MHQEQGCYGAPVIRLPRHVVNRVVTVLPILYTRRRVLTTFHNNVFIFIELSFPLSPIAREGGGTKTEGGIYRHGFFLSFQDLNAWVEGSKIEFLSFFLFLNHFHTVLLNIWNVKFFKKTTFGMLNFLKKTSPEISFESDFKKKFKG